MIVVTATLFLCVAIFPVSSQKFKPGRNSQKEKLTSLFSRWFLWYRRSSRCFCRHWSNRWLSTVYSFVEHLWLQISSLFLFSIRNVLYHSIEFFRFEDLRTRRNMERRRHGKICWRRTKNQYSSKTFSAVQRWSNDINSFLGFLRCHFQSTARSFARKVRSFDASSNRFRCRRFLLAGWKFTGSLLFDDSCLKISEIDLFAFAFVSVRISVRWIEWKTFSQFGRFYWLCCRCLSDDFKCRWDQR